MKPFWILWNPKGVTPPMYRFGTLAAAKKRAAEMQSNIGEGTMYVMKAVAGVTVSKITKWEEKERS